MISPSILSMVADTLHRAGATEDHGGREYELAIQAILRAKPDMTRSSAVRLLNVLLEIGDPNGWTAASGIQSPMETPIMPSCVEYAGSIPAKVRCRDSQTWRDGGYARITDRMLSDVVKPAAVLVDHHGMPRYFSGRINRYLNRPASQTNLDVVGMARDGLKGMLQRLIRQAARTTDVRKITSIARVRYNGDIVQVHLSLFPVADAEPGETLFLVCFADKTFEAQSIIEE